MVLTLGGEWRKGNQRPEPARWKQCLVLNLVLVIVVLEMVEAAQI